MRTLFIILLGCFCLCLTAPLLLAESTAGHTGVGVHVTTTYSHSFSEAEVVELEDLEDRSISVVHDVAYDQDFSTDCSSAVLIPIAPCDVAIQETPRYIRVRHLRI